VIDPIRTRPHMYREADAIEEESKWEKVNPKGENQGIFVDKMNADLLGGTELVLGLEGRRRRFEGTQRERDARGKLRYWKQVERDSLST